MPTFGRGYIEQQLRSISTQLSSPIRLYLIGGAAMSFYDLKAATKDIDVIVSSEQEAQLLLNALQHSGYKKIERTSKVYRQMKTRAIIENPDEFRWDIFVNTVCNGLSLSEEMITRARPFQQLPRISLFLLSQEDIFIFKAVTSRPRDREDMFTLFSYGLDMTIITEEIKRQASADTRNAWLSFFFIGIDELTEQYHVMIPRYDEFLHLAENEMTERLLLTFLQQKPQSSKELAHRLQCPEKDIKDSLKALKTKQIIRAMNGRFYIRK